jgi:hypothetical protein
VIHIKALAQFRLVLESGSGLVITDGTNKRVFHPDPEGCTHIQEYGFATKVIENHERNGAYYAVPTLGEARREWPQIEVCKSGPCSAAAKPPSDDGALCRGWTAADVREATARATPAQLDVLVTIARYPNVTTAEIAEKLGLESYRNVRALLARLSTTTAPIGVRDPETGELSWPFEHRKPLPGTTFERYYMPPSVAQIVLEGAGRS